jgi:hypothetical protein
MKVVLPAPLNRKADGLPDFRKLNLESALKARHHGLDDSYDLGTEAEATAEAIQKSRRIAFVQSAIGFNLGHSNRVPSPQGPQIFGASHGMRSVDLN